jgi:hypothetical protein
MYKKIAIGVILISLFLTYSRYLWLYGAIAIALSYIVSKANKYYIYRGEAVSVSVAKMAVVSIGILLSLVAGGADIIVERFTGDSALSSDSQRVVMFFPLFNAFLDNPLMGIGMGAYVNEIIRVERLPWNYELQWLSFAMQFGVLGVTVLIVIAISPFLIFARMTIYGMSYTIMYALWVTVGVFNSFLLTSAAGVVFATFVAFGLNLRYLYIQRRRGYQSIKTAVNWV